LGKLNFPKSCSAARAQRTALAAGEDESARCAQRLRRTFLSGLTSIHVAAFGGQVAQGGAFLGCDRDHSSLGKGRSRSSGRNHAGRFFRRFLLLNGIVEGFSRQSRFRALAWRSRCSPERRRSRPLQIRRFSARPDRMSWSWEETRGSR
jgi:hypothetical protein